MPQLLRSLAYSLPCKTFKLQRANRDVNLHTKARRKTTTTKAAVTATAPSPPPTTETPIGFLVIPTINKNDNNNNDERSECPSSALPEVLTAHAHSLS